MATTDRELADVLSEFARTMLTDFPIQGILDHLVRRIVDIMPIDAAGVSLISSQHEPPRYVAASNGVALRFVKLQTELEEGPCLEAHRTNAPVSIPDLLGDERFPSFAAQAKDAGLVAVFSFPLRHGRRDPIGALDLYRETPGPLDEAATSVAQTLADVAAAYILNAQARQDLQDAADRFQSSSLHDALTGLPNRVLFAQLLEHAVLRTRRSGRKLAVLFADLDRFKEVNDLYGHHVGDALLIAVAGRLGELLRPEDSLARLGGDEFVILCEGIDAVADVEHLAERIDAGMNQPFALADQELHVTASIGIAYSGLGHDVPGRLLRDADTAMYQAKRRGGGHHQVLDLREQEQHDDRATLSHDLYGALERGEIDAHYQPMVSAADGRIVGVEALLRWTHPGRGPVSPGLLLPLAESTRMLCDIGRWIFERACLDRRDWVAAHPSYAEIGLSVNVSPHELLTCDYDEMVAAVLDQTGTDPRFITVEVTEHVLIDDPDRAMLAFGKLKDLGVALALDDFGTGYSSLSYLQRLPIDVVKIDRTFVTQLAVDPATRAITAAVIDLAHALDKTVVAEGMETPEEREQLRAYNCDVYQGYYFAKPMTAPAVADLLSRTAADPALRLPIIDLAPLSVG